MLESNVNKWGFPINTNEEHFLGKVKDVEFFYQESYDEHNDLCYRVVGRSELQGEEKTLAYVSDLEGVQDAYNFFKKGFNFWGRFVLEV